MSTPIQYASFLIRIWRETRAGEVLTGADWHAEVEHIQSNQHWTFITEDELLSFLQQQAENIPADVREAFLEVLDNKNSAPNNNSSATHIPSLFFRKDDP